MHTQEDRGEEYSSSSFQPTESFLPSPPSAHHPQIEANNSNIVLHLLFFPLCSLQHFFLPFNHPTFLPSSSQFMVAVVFTTRRPITHENEFSRPTLRALSPSTHPSPEHMTQ
mmetsp:Transcript_43584/g.85976  ORF Transcript_43584/g.85976 Transcript_43584/m.85976 type:complete len:112 (+) Transcript_43584:726-1061(+)